MGAHSTLETPVEKNVLAIQQGDEEKHDNLLKSYQPFIAKAVSEVCKRYIDPQTDDEFSIGLAAMSEAIFLYSPEKGCGFLTFAKMIIKRKVIDYIRYQSKRQGAVSFEQFYDEENMENPAEISTVINRYKEEQNIIRLREEIFDYKEKLREFKLSLIELTEVSPKHRDARETAVRIARILINNNELREYVVTKKKLPIKKLQNQVTVSKKTLERNRKFILAIFIVLNENYFYLQDYIKGVGR